MKRILPFAFFFLTAQFVASLHSSAQCTGANMYNPIVVGTIGAGSNYSNTQYNGNSCFGNDYGQPSYDIYYQFTITSSQQVNISLCGSGFDTYVWLLDANGNQITYNDDYGPLCSTNESSISQTLGAGTYYIVSEGYSSNSGNIVTQISIPGSAGGGGGTSVGWAASGSDIYNTNTGNVGIGTSTPRGALDVKKDADVYLLNSTSGGSTSSNFLSGHVYFAPYSTSDVVYLQARRQNELGSTALRFRTYNNGSLVESMHIAGTGNVGIGTIDPQYKLDVSGSLRVLSSTNPLNFTGVWSGTPDFNSNASEITNDVTNSKRLMIVGNKSAGADRRVGIWDKLDIGGAGFDQTLNVNGGGYFNGNVGIGTSSPSERLQVSGNAYITNNLGIGRSGAIHNNAAILDVYGAAMPGNPHIMMTNQNNTQWEIRNDNTSNKFTIDYWGGSSRLSNVLTIDNGGHVSIGTANSQDYRLMVGGGDIKSYNWDSNTGVSIGAESSERPRIGFHVSDNNRRFKIEFNGVNSASERLGFFTNNGGAWGETEVFSIGKTGTVGIGTIDTKGYKLAVNGDAIFTKIKIKSYSTWPDYVFASAYRLPSLAQVEAFIRQHNHLPEVPSAKEVEEKGLDVGDNQAVLLKKVEELTLYIIDQNKKIEQLEKEVQSIKAARTN